MISQPWFKSWPSVVNQQNTDWRKQGWPRSMSYLHNRISYTGKISLHWIRTQIVSSNSLVLSLVYSTGSYTLRLRQNVHHFTDIFKCSMLNEKVQFFIKISLKHVPKSPINNKSPLVQIMAWCRSGDKPLSKPMMVYRPDIYMHHSASMSLEIISDYVEKMADHNQPTENICSVNRRSNSLLCMDVIYIAAWLVSEEGNTNPFWW